jgi:hypothetical protein
MLNKLVLEEEEDGERRMPKKCLWWSTVGMLFAVSTVGLFLSLYVRSKFAHTRLDTEYEAAHTNFTLLHKQNAEVSLNHRQASDRNSQLQIEIKKAQETIQRLKVCEHNLTFELANTQAQLAIITKQLWITGLAGGLSLLANSALLPYAIATSAGIEAAQSQAGYLEPRYFQGLLQSLGHFIAKQEGQTTLQFTPLFNSSISISKNSPLDKHNLMARLAGHGNTATFFVTTGQDIMAFVLYSPWDFVAATIDDSRAFTVSFRKLATTMKTTGPAVHNTQDFLHIGDREIVLKEDGSGEAVTNRGFKPIVEEPNAADFYVYQFA